MFHPDDPTEDDADAGNQLEDETPGTPKEDSAPKEDTFFLPPDFPGATDFTAGDMIHLTVVGHSVDGELEVKTQPATPENEDMMTDLKRTLSTDAGGGGKGMMKGMM